jgi:putative transposase
LQRHGLPPAPERRRTTTWSAFIRTHLALLAGTDFFTAEVFTLRGLVTYYVLFFIHLESRRVDIAGITVHPDESWMQQMARNVTMEGCGALRAVVISCTIATPSTPSPSERSLRQAGSSRSCCLPEART